MVQVKLKPGMIVLKVMKLFLFVLSVQENLERSSLGKKINFFC